MDFVFADIIGPRTHTTAEKFENAALFLRLGDLGLSSTLIGHENARTENILKTEVFENDKVTIIV